MREGLNRVDLEVYVVIRALISETGRKLTVRQLADRYETKSLGHMQKVLARLQQAGLIVREPGKHRSIDLARDTSLKFKLGDHDGPLYRLAAEEGVSAESIVLRALQRHLALFAKRTRETSNSLCAPSVAAG